MIKKISLVAISALALAACNDQASTGGAAGGSRQEIRIVGSSTVFPFAKAASEAFAKADPSRKSPVLESTGTGGGIEQFCKGVGAETPDIANASRRMKKSEFENCQKNGVKDIVEVQVGIDGLALAQSNKGTKFVLSTVTAAIWKSAALWEKGPLCRSCFLLHRRDCHNNAIQESFTSHLRTLMAPRAQLVLC